MTPKNKAQGKMPKWPSPTVPDFYRINKERPPVGPVSRQQADREIQHAVQKEHDRGAVVLVLTAIMGRASYICQRAYDLATLPAESQRSDLLAVARLYDRLGKLRVELEKVFLNTRGWEEQDKEEAFSLLSKWAEAINAGETGDKGAAIRSLARDDFYGIQTDGELVDLADRLRPGRKTEQTTMRVVELIQQYKPGCSWSEAAARILNAIDVPEAGPTDREIVGQLKLYEPDNYLKQVWKRAGPREGGRVITI